MNLTCEVKVRTKDKVLLEPEKLKLFPNSFLEFFLTQDEISEVTKVLILDILTKRQESN
jgi:hypothetical protein